MTSKNPKTKALIKEFYRSNKLAFAIAAISYVGSAAIMLGISLILQIVMDFVSGVNTGFKFWHLLVMTLGLIVVTIFGYIFTYNSEPIFLSKALMQYRQHIFENLMKKRISAFSGERSSLYISSLTNDIFAVETGLLSNLFALINSVLTFVGALVMMLCYSPLLTLVALVLAAVPVVVSILIGSNVEAAEKAVSDKNEEYTAMLKDTLGGFSVIKSFKAENRISNIFAENIKKLSQAKCKKNKMMILVNLFGTIASLISQIGVFLFGAYMVVFVEGSTITAGVVLLFVQLMNYILSPLSTLPKIMAERKAAIAMVDKIAEALDSNASNDSSIDISKLENGIKLEGLSFEYEEGKPVLNNVNYFFELGKKYAIVGGSGSGKTTMLNLLMSSYHSYDGSISYDDIELRDISSSSLYDIQSIIQQNVFVFNATIRDNITMFGEFDDEEVTRAINLSGLSVLIEKRGEEYLCGENGNGLSGGEKQRISIARSLLKKSQVLLVDEATAALDAETAYQVSSSIIGLEGATAIVVTHSLDEALLKQYDGILTLKNGSLIEYGTFDELMERKEYFYSLFTVSQ
jgi:ABC-type multidrug transport system fused ATPase/permease subunit